MPALTRETIVESIRSMGVRRGDCMIVHSSFKSLGDVEGGPLTVAEALVESVAPGGSVFVPTFNYGNDPYDPATTPSYDGVITEFVRKLPGAVRSDHPTHPIAGIGRDAFAVLRDHANAQPFGVGSPCWRLWERNAWVLLIGVNHNANSIAHVAEELLNMPYLDRRRTARVVTPQGIKEVELRRPGCSDAWDAVLDPALRKTSSIIDGTIGDARVMLMRGRDIVDATASLLRRDPQVLLCHNPACGACNSARQMLADS